MKEGSNPGGAASHARSTSSGDRVRTRWRLKSCSSKSGWDGSAEARGRGGVRAEEVPRGSGRGRGRDETPGRSLGGGRDGASRIQRSPPSGRIAFTQRAYPRTGGFVHPRANGDDRGAPELRRGHPTTPTTMPIPFPSDDGNGDARRARRAAALAARRIARFDAVREGREMRCVDRGKGMARSGRQDPHLIGRCVPPPAPPARIADRPQRRCCCFFSAHHRRFPRRLRARHVGCWRADRRFGRATMRARAPRPPRVARVASCDRSRGRVGRLRDSSRAPRRADSASEARALAPARPHAVRASARRLAPRRVFRGRTRTRRRRVRRLQRPARGRRGRPVHRVVRGRAGVRPEWDTPVVRLVVGVREAAASASVNPHAWMRNRIFSTRTIGTLDRAFVKVAAGKKATVLTPLVDHEAERASVVRHHHRHREPSDDDQNDDDDDAATDSETPGSTPSPGTTPRTGRSTPSDVASDRDASSPSPSPGTGTGTRKTTGTGTGTAG